MSIDITFPEKTRKEEDDKYERCHAYSALEINSDKKHLIIKLDKEFLFIDEIGNISYANDSEFVLENYKIIKELDSSTLKIIVK